MLVDLQIILLTLFFMKVQSGGGGTSRSKRWLLTPVDTQVGAFVTISTPLEGLAQVSFAYFFEANYYTLANSSYLGPLLGDSTVLLSGRRFQRDTIAREAKEDGTENIETTESGNPNGFTRSLIYHSIEKTMDRRGLDGRKCLLRAICENSLEHFHHNGLLGDLLHILLTPSSSESEDEIQDEFYLAELRGRNETGCGVYTHACPHSVLETISLPMT